MPLDEKILRVALVVPFVDGVITDDAIAVEYLKLYRMLKKSGHDVTMLCPSVPAGHAFPQEWEETGTGLRVELEKTPCRFLPHQYGNGQYLTGSYDTYLYLRESNFDVVHFADWQGIGFYTLLAKQQKSGFQDTLIQVGAYGVSAWRDERNHRIPNDVNDLILEFTERKCLELADVIRITDLAQVSWMEAQGWKLPKSRLGTESGAALSDLIADWEDVRKAAEQSEPSTDRKPLVSVCMAHFNRPHFLRQSLESIERQDYPHVEFVLVDDGSDTPEAITYLAELEPKFAERGWQLIRQKNSYLGAARNNAARHAKGEYILFMDDDNYAEPYEISRYVSVALQTGADMLTCTMKIFQGDGPPDLAAPPMTYFDPNLGPATCAGIFYNCFGDANALVRRSAFLQAGGFPEDRDYALSDWEFFARAVLSGFRLQTVPEALFWYRQGHERMSTQTSRYLNTMRRLRPYLEILPEPLKAVAHFSNAQNQQARELDELQAASRHLVLQSSQTQSILTAHLAKIRAAVVDAIENFESKGYEEILAELERVAEETRLGPARSDQEAAVYLDMVGPADWSPGETEIKLQQGHSITMRGWAFDRDAASLAAEVSLVIDGTLVEPALYGLGRPDVALHFANPQIENCGFKLIFDSSKLTPGMHTAVIRVMGPDLKCFYESAQLTLDVRAAHGKAPDVVNGKALKPRALAVVICTDKGESLPELIAYMRANNHDLIIWDYASSDGTPDVLKNHRHELVEHRVIPSAFGSGEICPAMSENLLANYVGKYDWITWLDGDEIPVGPEADRSYYEHIVDVFNSSYDWVEFASNTSAKSYAWKAHSTVIRDSVHCDPKGSRYPQMFSSRPRSKRRLQPV